MSRYFIFSSGDIFTDQYTDKNVRILHPFPTFKTLRGKLLFILILKFSRCTTKVFFIRGGGTFVFVLKINDIFFSVKS